MSAITDLIRREPVAFQAVIQSLLGMLMSFGLKMTAPQMGSVLVFTAAVLAWWTRQQVTSHPNNAAMAAPTEK